ncbi:hypothetical protein Tco_1132110 [Tanacetum coccineum]|uniref:Uncharacterized protein n=1 Tax=Tanacetum coccineum TaxID=301880 RepID=A0ABQ5JB17_9ASTR
MVAGGRVLGGGDGCDGDDVVRVGMTIVVDLWCGSGGGWPESGRNKVERRQKSIRRRGEKSLASENIKGETVGAWVCLYKGFKCLKEESGF